MGLLRPATPGFLVTLVAAILLAVVSFSVPLFKSVYFLKASYNVQNVNGTITFGTLGYCIQIGTNTTCSNPTIGYELDINKLVGNKLPIEIPQVVVKWLTYALVLHIVALGLAATSAVFGLLAHVREMSMTCCSTCVSGFAAAVALVAFLFDVAFFFLAKTRINKVQGGAASTGSAIWLTLSAWVLLFFSGCFFMVGRCCIRRRPKGDNRANGGDTGFGAGNGYAEQMRLDAVKAEADRKAKQKQGEVGLPAFQEYDLAEPLKARVTDDGVYLDDDSHLPYHDQHNTGAYVGPSRGASGYVGGGYVQGAPGTRAVDDYYLPTESRPGAYPPQPRRQGSTHTQSSTYPYSNASTAPPMPTNNIYQHGNQQTSYYSSHQQNPTDTPYNPYPNQTPSSPRVESSYNPYQSQPPSNIPANLYYTQSPPPPVDNYFSPSPPIPQPHERSYTLGGDGYGGNILPPPQGHDASYGHYIPPINTNIATAPGPTSPVRGPRSPRSPPLMSSPYDDSPPVYESGASHVAPSGWGSKN